MKRFSRGLLILSIVSALLPGPVFTHAQEAAVIPVFEPVNCPFDIPAGETAECGFLVVPQDREEADSLALRLFVARFKSHHPNPPDDPVLYLMGGPGGSALFDLDATFFHFSPYLATHDVIVLDQRGTGFSQPSFDCQNPEVLFNAAYYRRCRTELREEGIDPADYNTAENAADVRDLRLALEIEEWNLVGVSYGTLLALIVMRDYPAGIRSVILDSVYPPQQIGAGYIPSEPFMRRVLDDCAADVVCNAAYPNLNQVYDEVVARLDRDPARIRPKNMPDSDEDGDTVFNTYYLDGDELLREFLSHTTSALAIPKTLYALYEGDYEAVLDRTHFPPSIPISNEMNLSVACRDLRTTSGGIFSIDGTVCSAWGVPLSANIRAEPVASDIPTLLLSGSYDVVTPPANAEAAAGPLRQHYIYEIPYTSHGVVRSGGECPQQIARDFLEQPFTEPDSRCIAAMQPQFIIDRHIVIMEADHASTR